MPLWMSVHQFCDSQVFMQYKIVMLLLALYRSLLQRHLILHYKERTQIFHVYIEAISSGLYLNIQAWFLEFPIVSIYHVDGLILNINKLFFWFFNRDWTYEFFQCTFQFIFIWIWLIVSHSVQCQIIKLHLFLFFWRLFEVF